MHLLISVDKIDYYGDTLIILVFVIFYFSNLDISLNLFFYFTFCFLIKDYFDYFNSLLVNYYLLFYVFF